MRFSAQGSPDLGGPLMVDATTSLKNLYLEQQGKNSIWSDLFAKCRKVVRC